jgi:hypothetical protein
MSAMARSALRLSWLVAALAATGCGGAAHRSTTVAARAPLAFAPQLQGTPPTTLRPTGRYLTVALVHRTALRVSPGGRVITQLHVQTEFGSQTTLGVVARRPGWLEVETPELANDERGWIREAGAHVSGTNISIRVDRTTHLARLLDGTRTVLRFPVAVGRPGNETPLGRFSVTDRLTPTDATSPYGCCALALTGHQRKLEPGWPGGDRLAIHGTPAAWSIGKAVSLGCMRAARGALHELMRRVPLGAPVFVST